MREDPRLFCVTNGKPGFYAICGFTVNKKSQTRFLIWLKTRVRALLVDFIVFPQSLSLIGKEQFPQNICPVDFCLHFMGSLNYMGSGRKTRLPCLFLNKSQTLCLLAPENKNVGPLGR